MPSAVGEEGHVKSSIDKRFPFWTILLVIALLFSQSSSNLRKFTAFDSVNRQSVRFNSILVENTKIAIETTTVENDITLQRQKPETEVLRLTTHESQLPFCDDLFKRQVSKLEEKLPHLVQYNFTTDEQDLPEFLKTTGVENGCWSPEYCKTRQSVAIIGRGGDPTRTNLRGEISPLSFWFLE